MDIDHSFGQWLRQHRRALDLTQEELAARVGCSAITLRKLEAEERRPSKQITERLAEVLSIPSQDREAFMRFARGDPFAAPSAAPAGRVPGTEPRRHNLPLQLTSFIGREQEVADVGRLITGSASRLVTLVGTGGSGKTRLSQQAVTGVLPAFADGAWLVELAPLADPALVASTTAGILGLPLVPRRTPLEQLLDFLRPKRLLLVLDNCEHLLQACAGLAESLLRACPQLVILATSREGLGVPGESLHHVGSLSLPDADTRPTPDSLAEFEAVQLFVARAAARLPGFSLTRANAPAVAQICRQLDGIPLALELAAARVNLLPVEEIAARLNDRFHLLTGGSRTALPRHQTLQALFDWSFDLLSEPEARLLRRLAVFAGGWTLDAAETICDDDGGTPEPNAPIWIGASAVLDLLGGLVNKSLVGIDRLLDQSMRYSFLETIRQYVLARLDASGEAGWVRSRHANFYLALGEAGAYVSPSPPGWVASMIIERDNLRAALAWSQASPTGADLGLRLAKAMHTGIHLNNFPEARGWLEQALAKAEAEGIDNPPIRARILYSLGFEMGLIGEYAASEVWLGQALDLARQLNEPRLVAAVFARLGWTARERGDTVIARRRLEENVSLWRELGDAGRLAEALNTLAGEAIIEGDLVRAETLVGEALTLFRKVGDRYGKAWSLNHLGLVAQFRNELDLAARLHSESLVLFEAMDTQQYGPSEANHALGETALAAGSFALARTHFARSQAAATQNRYLAVVAWNLAGFAGVALLDEDPERAARLWGAAESLRQSIGVREAPGPHATRQRMMATAREQLGEAVFAAQWAAGEVLTLDEAIAEAAAEN